MIFIVYIYQYKKYSLNFTYMYAVWKKPNWNNAYKIFKSFKNCLPPNTLRIKSFLIQLNVYQTKSQWSVHQFLTLTYTIQ